MKYIHLFIIIMLVIGAADAAPLIRPNQINWTQNINSQLNGVTAGTSSLDAANMAQAWEKLNKSSDTLGSNLAAGGYKITGLAAGTSTGDAARMGQLWALVNKSGDTMTGNLAITGYDVTGIDELTFDASGPDVDLNGRKLTDIGAGTTSTDASNMANTWTKLNKSGDTLTGTLTATGQDITGIDDITFDAAGSTIDFNARKLADLGAPTTSGDAVRYQDLYTKINKSGDTMSGALAMGTNRITGMGDSVNTQDAATRGQMLAGDLLQLNKTGGTMTGNIAMGGSYKLTGLAAGSTNGDSVRYEQLASYLPLAGGTLAGTVNANSNDITNIDDITFDASGSTIDLNARKLSDIGAGTTTGDAAAIQQVWSQINKTDIGTYISGTSGYIPKFTGANAIAGNSPIYVSGTNVASGTTSLTDVYTGFVSGQLRNGIELQYATNTTTGVPYPAISMVNRVTGTTGIIGGVLFSNYWSDTSADKRLASIFGKLDGASNSGYLSFSTSSAGTIAERMRIGKDGYIGIGKTGAYPLDVSGIINTESYLQMTGIGTQAAPAADAIKIYSKSGVPVYRNETGEYSLAGGEITLTGGDFYGVASSTTDDIITFADTGGKTAKDSGKKLSDLVYKDGSTTLTGALPFGGYKGTGVGNGTLAQDISTQVLAAHGTAYVRKEGSNYISTLATGADYQTGTDPDAIVNGLFDYYASLETSIEVLCPLTDVNAVMEFHSSNSSLKFHHPVTGTAGLLKISGSFNQVDFGMLRSTTDATYNTLYISGHWNNVNGNYLQGGGKTSPYGLRFDGDPWQNIVHINRIQNYNVGVAVLNASQGIYDFGMISDVCYGISMYAAGSGARLNGNSFTYGMICNVTDIGINLNGAGTGAVMPWGNAEGNFFSGSIVGCGVGAINIAYIYQLDSTYTMIRGCADAYDPPSLSGNYDILDHGSYNQWDMNFVRRASNCTINASSQFRCPAIRTVTIPTAPATWSGTDHMQNAIYGYHDTGDIDQIVMWTGSDWERTTLSP